MRQPSCCAGLIAVLALAAGCSGGEPMTDPNSGSVESRAVRDMQRPTRPGAVAQSGSPAQVNMQMPTWPQKFEVQGPEVDSFGFAVTESGPITVDVQAQGAPLLVTLQSAGGPPVTQPATGALRMTYTVTPQDVKRSKFWVLNIRLAQPMPVQQGGRAAGTVNVQHPPAEPGQVQAAIEAHKQGAQQQIAQQEAQLQQASAQAAAQSEQAYQQRKAHLEQQEAGRRAALFAAIQPQLNQLRGRAAGEIRPRGVEGEVPQGQGDVQESAPPEGTDEIGTRGMKSSPSQAGRNLQMLQQAPLSSSQQASTAAGSTPPPQQVMPNPVISSLSVAQGRPGDPLFINGSNFGTAGGEVRFVMGPGRDLPAPSGVVWTNNQIFATIPDDPGLLAFNGTIYIKRAGETLTSNLAPFHFDPVIVTRDYKMPAMLSDYRYEFPVHFPDHTRHFATLFNGNVFSGLTGTNEYFPNTTLKNGWVLDEVYYTQPGSLSCLYGCSYLLEKRIGSSQPYFSVRYWVYAPNFGSGANFTSYLIDRISLRGPKGVPDGLACTQAPCSP